MKLRFKRLDDYAILPSRAHEGDAGLDLYSTQNIAFYSGEIVAVGTGIAVEIPHGYVGLIHPRSGLAAREGITVVNAPGTIDAAYRGEIKVLLTSIENTVSDVYEDGEWPVGEKIEPTQHTIGIGDRIAQLVIQKVELPEPVWVSELSNTARGSGGFGSTGL